MTVNTGIAVIRLETYNDRYGGYSQRLQRSTFDNLTQESCVGDRIAFGVTMLREL